MRARITGPRWKTNTDGPAYLTDFGIARDLRGELGATISSDGQIMGTPALMPPEQARGDVQAIDARSDIYSLGATLYSKLTGQWPFEASNVVDMLHAVLHDDAPAPPPAEAEEPQDWRTAAEIAREISGWDANLYRVGSDLPRTYSRLDRVIEQLDAVLAEQPATGWARFYRGLARFRRGDLTGALEDMERSIDRVGDLGSAYFELGRLYLALYFDERRRAQGHISRLGTDWDLQSARSHVELAGLAFQEAGRLEPDLPLWQIRYSDAVKRLAEGDHAGCVAACDEILREEPDREEVWKLQGDAFARIGCNPLPCYERALEIRRSYFEVLLAMAELLLETEARDAIDEALALLGEAKELGGCRNRVNLLTGHALLHRGGPGDPARVVEMCREHLALEDSTPWRELLTAAESGSESS